MKVSVLFDQSATSGTCVVSRDIFDQCQDSELQRFAEIRIPSYDYLNEKPCVFYVQLDGRLPSGTIRLSAKLFDVSSFGPAVNCCYINIMKEKPHTFDTVAIVMKEQMYDKLMLLSRHEQKLEFLKIKFGLNSEQTVIWNGFTLAPSLCVISYCTPHQWGLVNFQSTQIIFAKDKSFISSSKVNNINNFEELSLAQARNTSMRLRCLKHPVPIDLIKPVPPEMDDDSIYAFATFETLISLGIPSGCYAKITNNSISRLVKLYVFANPNNFESFEIFVHPRVIAQYPTDDSIFVNTCSMNESTIQIASSVSLARVGCWNQSQKALQNIIFSNLKMFFTSKRRILHKGDLIPIPFDSNISALYAEDFKAGLPFTQEDRLVWFFVEDFEVEHKDHAKGTPEFVIDPNRTKLVTANIVCRAPLTTDRCDYISFYGLKSTFDYDLLTFPYAEKICDILTSFLKYRNKSLSIESSILLHSCNANTGKSTLVEFAALKLGFHLFAIDCTSLTATIGSMDSTAKIMGYIKGKLDVALLHSKPAIIYLSHLDVILGKGDQAHDAESTKVTRTMDMEIAKLVRALSTAGNEAVFIASVNDINNVPQNIRNAVKFDINIPIPTENQRKEIFKWQLSTYQLNQCKSVEQQRFCTAHDISYPKLALQSAGLTPLDIEQIVQKAKYNCYNRSFNSAISHCCSDMLLFITMADLSSAISKTRDEFSVSIGAPKIPKVSWKDIGGMDMIQGEIIDTIEMPLKHPELFAMGMKKRSGILFYGPPGTGKTLMAKAIATNFSLNFFSIKGPEILNMYIGESEANVRRIFQKARDAKPCVIFFDELDSVAPKRGVQGDSGGVMDRIVSQLLAELDSMGSEGDGVFVIGATNRPDLLDEALLRPGRFDKLLYLGISDTNEKQLNILKALTRKFSLSTDVNLMDVAVNCPFTYTGADFYALCSDAMLNAMSRIAEEVDFKVAEYNKTHMSSISVRYWFDRLAKEEDIRVTVRMIDFLKAQRELSPSVSEDELSHYLRVKSNFENS